MEVPQVITTEVRRQVPAKAPSVVAAHRIAGASRSGPVPMSAAYTALTAGEIRPALSPRATSSARFRAVSACASAIPSAISGGMATTYGGRLQASTISAGSFTAAAPSANGVEYSTAAALARHGAHTTTASLGSSTRQRSVSVEPVARTRVTSARSLGRSLGARFSTQMSADRPLGGSLNTPASNGGFAQSPMVVQAEVISSGLGGRRAASVLGVTMSATGLPARTNSFSSFNAYDRRV